MPLYTVFDDEFEEFAAQQGLTLQGAFHWVMKSCGFDYRFERRGADYVLIASDMDHPEIEPHELRTSLANDLEARRELMAQAIDGRFKAKMALSDQEFKRRVTMLEVKGALR